MSLVAKTAFNRGIRNHWQCLMVSLLMAFFSLLTHSVSALDKRIEVTIYVDDAYRPFSFSQQNQAKGIYISILNAAFSKMDRYKVSLEPIPWNRGKLLMKLGDGFALAPVFFHGHDWSYLYPYSLPFYDETIIAVCSEITMKTPRANWPENYKGLLIGNVAGFDGWGGDKFRRMIKEKKIDYVEVQKSDTLIKMLLQGRLDCILMENKAFDFEMGLVRKTKQSEQEARIKVVKAVVVGIDPVYVGYSETAIKQGKYPFAYDFQKRFDSIIYQMTKSGEIKAIIANYLQ